MKVEFLEAQYIEKEPFRKSLEHCKKCKYYYNAVQFNFPKCKFYDYNIEEIEDSENCTRFKNVVGLKKQE